MRNWLKTIILGIFPLLIAAGCRNATPPVTPKRPHVAVSLAPYKYFVERLAGDLFDVTVIVPPGADPHTFEITPRQMEALTSSKVWFSIGEPFERRLAKTLMSQRADLVVADLRQGWDRPLLHHDHEGHGHGAHCCQCHLLDRHLWMSPKRASFQADFIAKTLSDQFPDHREIFERRLQYLKQDLRVLSDELTAKLAGLENRWVLVSHPALGYFCEDFGLQQLSLEVEGKEASPQQLAHLLEQAKHLPIGCIMTQAQHNPAGAQWVANQLGLSTELVDPYHGDYLTNLRRIADLFVKAQKARACSVTPPDLTDLREPEANHGS